MKFYSNTTRGFTLIELLVVIAIIGMLSSTILASLNSARAKGRHARRLSDLKQLQTAFEMYYNDNNKYPSYSGSKEIDDMKTEIESYFPADKVPSDPRYGESTGNYKYQSSADTDAQGYALQMVSTESPMSWCWMSTSLDTMSPPASTTPCK